MVAQEPPDPHRAPDLGLARADNEHGVRHGNGQDDSIRKHDADLDWGELLFQSGREFVDVPRFAAIGAQHHDEAEQRTSDRMLGGLAVAGAVAKVDVSNERVTPAASSPQRSP